jgi:hypothetical protein
MFKKSHALKKVQLIQAENEIMILIAHKNYRIIWNKINTDNSQMKTINLWKPIYL